MADAAVRPKKPATSRRTPAGGAPTAPHTPEEASEPRIDVAHVTDMLLGTWADTRREAREMIKDPAFWRVTPALLRVYGDIGLTAFPLSAPPPGEPQRYLVCRAEKDLEKLLALLPQAEIGGARR